MTQIFTMFDELGSDNISNYVDSSFASIEG